MATEQRRWGVTFLTALFLVGAGLPLILLGFGIMLIGLNGFTEEQAEPILAGYLLCAGLLYPLVTSGLSHAFPTHAPRFLPLTALSALMLWILGACTFSSWF